jgi:ubiquinone/menaquinone biosynthesis C-methylase UbiE
MSEETDYVLGGKRQELERPEQQSIALEPVTRQHLGTSEIDAGMPVLDLAAGIGDVAFLVSELVGQTGHVVGMDQSIDALGYAAPVAARNRQRQVRRW